jgi:hypothetical protein
LTTICGWTSTGCACLPAATSAAQAGRLTGGTGPARELVERLMFDGSLPADLDMLSSKFNMERFFQREFFPLSLYYLGMVTFRDEYALCFPNLSVKKIFTEYFNELENISVSDGYTDMFRRFLADNDWAALFAGYWDRYVGQIPAQAFDQANENFFRTTFYELCTRYLSRHSHTRPLNRNTYSFTLTRSPLLGHTYSFTLTRSHLHVHPYSVTLTRSHSNRLDV